MEKKAGTSLLRRMSMVLLGLILVASTAIWPVGVNRASAAPVEGQWLSRSMSEYGNLRDVAYGNGAWIAVGDGGTILRSTDTVNWEDLGGIRNGQGEVETRRFNGVKYLNGLWIVVGDSAMIYTSTDGQIWTSRNGGSTLPALNSVSLGQGEAGENVYLAVGEENAQYTSSNGTAWNLEAGSSIPSVTDVTYGNGQFAAVSTVDSVEPPTVSTLVYGQTWNSSPLPGAPAAITFAADEFIVPSRSDNALYSSSDGSTWAAQTLSDLSVGITFRDAAYDQGSGSLMLLGNSSLGNIAAVRDSQGAWVEELINDGTTVELRSVAVNGTSAVAVGDGGSLFVRGATVDSDNTLSSLTLSGATLNTPFSSDNFEYTATAASGTTAVNVTTVTSSVYASVTVNGREAADNQPVEVTLSGPGTTTPVDITVTPQVGDPQQYTISIFREAEGPNAFLETLSIDPGTLTPDFIPTETSYTATVSNTVYNLQVTADPFDPNAVVTIEGNTVTGGEAQNVSLNYGENEITIVVRANEETTQTYRILVTRQSRPVDPAPGPGPGPGPFIPNPSPVTPAPVTPTTPAPTTPVPTTPTTPGNDFDDIATGTTSQVNGQTVFTARIDTARLAALLTGETSQIIVLPVTAEADRVVATMTGEAAALLTSSSATLRVETALGNYILPSSQLQLSSAANTLGVAEGSSELTVNITIEESSTAVQNNLSQAAAAAGFTAVSEPVDFTISAAAGDRTAEINEFSEYVQRELPIPADTNSSQVTTGVVIEPDGTVRHVPTAVVQVNDASYAQVSSLTNSSYALISNLKEFPDVAGKWSQDPVNDMASRLVVNGVGDNRFNPEGAVTRAEFSAILVRALGLPSSGQTTAFSDVTSGEWYAEAAATANRYNLIKGYPDGTFRPNATITRQEAFAIMERATTIVPLRVLENGSELSSYRDREDVADWARRSTEILLEAGLVKGSGGLIRPDATLSRAESATFAQRLLQQGALINQ
ncbi:S-layer homology domain-containing protein [Saccharibacillus kuerlensis]|uniref:SLH domain-containing protein n=1 Tax=Saccharibacillus kuerlensis TaxID=459527 RepID=A0ABQ2LBN4_9BACL|nr:S-layer homology domain-containing protein [Saccharibacillus kuerlensis]GGO09561.1 hypothetical protein GCM10010969_40110 [Saccharibacillus kuerlensis]